MNASTTCPKCGASLQDTAQGLCLRCLVQLGVALNAPAEPSPPGSILNDAAGGGRRFGDYELLEVIGRGGMGIVYKARQTSLNRIVALKMLLFGPQASPEFVKRFRAEAVLAASLQHPNIVSIHEVGVLEGQQFFVMDYVEGESLAKAISDFRFQISDFRRVARWMKTIAEAIHYAHERGILHRDLKPSNVLIDAQDQPRVTDFGLAKRFAGDSQVTVTGQVLGSPNYIPPEQALGKRGKVSRQSDVYALGAMLYHLLTGRPPFQGETITDTLQQVLHREPLTPRLLNPTLPLDLQTICLKCLEKEPARRYATAQALADDLERFLNGQPVLARPIGSVGKTWRWCRREPVRASLIAALAAVFIAGTAGILWQWQQARRNAAAAVAAGIEAEVREYDASIALAENLIRAHQFDLARDTLLRRTKESYRGWEWGWLLRICNQDLMTLSGNPALGVEAFFSPDSRLLVTSGFDSVIRLWEVATGNLIRGLTNHAGFANMTPFTLDGRRLGTFGWRGPNPTVCVWDTATWQPTFKPLLQPGMRYAALSRDGQRLATGGIDGKVRVYDAGTGADTGLVNQYGDHDICLAFSPDGRRLAYAGGSWFWTPSQDTSVRIWNLATGETKRLVGHDQVVFDLEWSPDSKMLVSCGADGKVLAWDPDTRQELLPRFDPSLERRIRFRAAFSPDGSLLGVVGGDLPNPTARATLFDVKTHRVIRELAGHSTVVQGIAFSDDGQYVVTSATLERTAKVWSVAELPAFVSLEGHEQTVWTAAFSPDGRRVATGSFDLTARIWDAANGFLLRTFVVGFPVVSLAFSHDGRRLATVGPDNSACVWQTNEKAENRKQETGAVAHDELLRLRGHTAAVMSVAWSPDDQWIATGSKDATAKLWDADTGAERLTLAGHSNLIYAVAYSPDGRMLATGSADGTARLWSTSAGECLRVLTHGSSEVLSLAFSPTDHVLATGAADRSARLWDTATGHQVHLMSGHVNGVSSVAFSPDGQRLVTAPGGTDLCANFAREYRVFFWDVASGRQLLTLPAHDNAIYAAAFSPGGERLVTASGDHTARIRTAFPWRSGDYLGGTNVSLEARVEEFKRNFWESALEDQRGSEQLARAWTNGFYLYHHMLGDLYLPAPGIKTRPLLRIPPRPAQATANQIDLSGLYNVALDESWQPIEYIADVDRTLSALPRGLQTFAGVAVDVRGFIQLRGIAPDSSLHPDRVVIPVKRAFARLQALHGTTWFERPGCEIGAFVLHYANGDVSTLPILFGEHLRGEDPRLDSISACPQGRLVWGAGLPTEPGDTRPRLYQTTFTNPKPGLEVVSIDYVSKLTRCGPLLVALTVE